MGRAYVIVKVGKPTPARNKSYCTQCVELSSYSGQNVPKVHAGIIARPKEKRATKASAIMNEPIFWCFVMVSIVLSYMLQ